MRINSTDAAISTQVRMADPGITVKDTSESIRPIKVEGTNHANISQMTPLEKSGIPISDRVLVEAIERANKAISGIDRKFEFSVHEKTGEIMIKVIDTDTDQIVREIPPEKILDLIANLMEMAGLLVDERR